MSFRFLTAGESHGKALVGIIEGLPSGLEFSQADLVEQMQRRKMGYGRGARQKIETDEVEILSGIRFGQSLGSPISLLLLNRDWQAWKDIMASEPAADIPSRREVSVPRPGHADLVGGIKYRHEDMRNVLERASARETAMRVALGCVARKFLAVLDIHIASRVTRIGMIADTEEVTAPIKELNEEVDRSAVRVLGKAAEEAMIHEIERVKKEGNTLGGEFEVYASGIPLGLGSYVQWDRRLEGDIAKAFLSLNAIKGVEIGLGFKSAAMKGSEVHDEYTPAPSGKVSYTRNSAGGIEGGMSTGQPLIVRAAMKPLSTLMAPLSSVNMKTGIASAAHIERSDVCAVPSAAVIGESLLALVITGAVLEKFGGDSIPEVVKRVEDWKRECRVG